MKEEWLDILHWLQGNSASLHARREKYSTCIPNIEFMSLLCHRLVSKNIFTVAPLSWWYVRKWFRRRSCRGCPTRNRRSRVSKVRYKVGALWSYRLGSRVSRIDSFAWLLHHRIRLVSCQELRTMKRVSLDDIGRRCTSRELRPGDGRWPARWFSKPPFPKYASLFLLGVFVDWFMIYFNPEAVILCC